MADSKLVMRYEELAFMDVGTSTADYQLIGEGFTSLSESKNPSEYSRKYIHQSSETTDVTGYSPSMAYSVDLYSNNPVIGRVVEIHDLEKVGTEARVNIVSVRMWQDAPGGGKVAFLRTYSVIPDAKGDGTDAMVYSGTFKAVGDLVKGVFVPNETKDSGTFTPDTASITGVTVSPPTATVAKGATQSFTAAVTGEGSPSQSVTWTISGAEDPETSISSGGVLSVDADETSESITVTATSAVDNSKLGTATVTVGT